VQSAYLQGVSSKSVEETLTRLGISPVDKSQIADLCAQLDDMIYEFRERPLNRTYPSLWIDVLKLNIQHSERAAQYALALAVGIGADGTWEILGFEVTRYAEGRAFWADFLGHLQQRGLQDVETVLSEAYDGLKPALRDKMPGTEWQPRRDSVETLPYSFVSAVSPTIWVDSSVPRQNTIVSGLSNMWLNMMPIYGHINFQMDTDELLVTRLAGVLLMEIQAAWHLQQKTILIS
jgi:hypothetical protein